MSKSAATTTETVSVEENSVKEAVVVTEKKIKKVKSEPANNVSVMYIGPTIEHIVKKSTVFKNGVFPEALNKLIKETPYIKKLLVPIDELPSAMREIGKEKSALNVIYEKVKKIRR